MNSVIIGIFTWILCIGLMFFCVYIISRYAGWFEKHSLKLLILSLILGLGLYFFGYYFRDSILFGGNSEGDFSLAELAASGGGGDPGYGARGPGGLSGSAGPASEIPYRPPPALL